MASWQPPIPAGALYSKAARALGPALPLLAYCYDMVDRDGCVKISLHTAASDMDEPYPTIKRWWSMVESGPFFAEVKKLGRNGMQLKFKTVWIDWRILESRPKTETFGAETGSEMIPNNETDTPVEIIRDVIGTETGSEMIPKRSGNKVLIDHDQAVFADVANATPPQRTSKRKTPDRTPEQQAYLDRKKAIEDAYIAELDYKPAAFGREAKAAKWLAEQSYTPDQVLRCLRHLQADDFYHGKHISLQTVSGQIGAFIKSKQIAPRPLTAIPPVVTRAPRPTPEETAREAQKYDPVGDWKRRKEAELRNERNADI